MTHANIRLIQNIVEGVLKYMNNGITVVCVYVGLSEGVITKKNCLYIYLF